MKNKLMGLMVVAAMAAIGCGVDTTEVADEGVAHTAASQAALCTCGAIPPMPPTPNPTDFRLYMRTHASLVTSSNKAPYVIVFQSPNDPNAFWAYGYDMVSNTVNFVVSGSTKNDFGPLTGQIANDFAIANTNGGIDGVMRAQTPKKPKGCCGFATSAEYAGVAHAMASRMYQVANQQ